MPCLYGILDHSKHIIFSWNFRLFSIHSKSWRPWRPVSANFFHFPPKFRLRTWKPTRLNCTNASPSVCRLCFVFNIPTSYIDLLYFDNLLLKTPDLCNLRTFVAIFFVAIYALFPPIFGGKKTDSANLSAFRMYAAKSDDQISRIKLDLFCKLVGFFVNKIIEGNKNHKVVGWKIYSVLSFYEK